MPLKKYIREVNDFPKKEIVFKEITPLLNDKTARNECLNILLSKLKDEKIDKVIGVESRDFFFGIVLSELTVPLVI